MTISPTVSHLRHVRADLSHEVDPGLVLSILDHPVLHKHDPDATLKVGAPTEADTIIGPLIRPQQCQFIDEQIKDAVDKGAKVLTGGKHDQSYYQPTVLADITPEMAIFHEESFGPVVCCIKAKNSDEAMELANNSSYGLSSAVITNDLEKAMQFADGLDAGMVHINATTIQCEPNVPFGIPTVTLHFGQIRLAARKWRRDFHEYPYGVH